MLPGVRIAFALILAASICTDNAAQSPSMTIEIATPDDEIIDTMIRNGSYGTLNQDGAVLLTRSSAVAEWERRTLMSIDVGRIPLEASVISATLTLTVKSGLGSAGATRAVTYYRLAAPFDEHEGTWISRRQGAPWQTPGGDLAEGLITIATSNTPGAKIDVNVTALVQRAMNGEFGARRVQIALVDDGDGSKDSYREYHSSEATSSRNRPKLSVVYRYRADPLEIDVPAGGDLQFALNHIGAGGIVRLAPGAVYSGNFVLPVKTGTGVVTITTNTTLPAAGTRIDPSYRPLLATIRSANPLTALRTASGAANYRIVGVAFDANVGGYSDVIALGRGEQTTLAEMPHHIELDRILIAGDAAVGQKRGISVNAAHVVIANSDIRGIKAFGQDSQAIAAWNTPGPLTIRNNFLEAAGENILIGGAHVAIPDLVPSDILVEHNLLTKDPSWRGSYWTVKNLFELKSARRVVVRGNTMEYNWSAAQTGYAVVFTPRNTGGHNPWSVIEDVEFIDNVVRHSGSAINLLGHDNLATSGQLARIVIRDNLFEGISHTAWGGSGSFAQIGGEPRDITIDHNTVMHTGNIVTFYSGSYYDRSGAVVPAGPTQGFVLTNNLITHNAYGIFGNNQAYGNGSLNYYAPGAIVRRNVIASNTSIASRYPADNFFPNVATFLAQFVNPALGDYRLVSGSPYVAAGTDGGDVGRR